MTQEEIKQALKEAMKEWMDDKYREFGKWSLMTVLALFVTSVVYFMLFAHGWAQK